MIKKLLILAPLALAACSEAPAEEAPKKPTANEMKAALETRGPKLLPPNRDTFAEKFAARKAGAATTSPASTASARMNICATKACFPKSKANMSFSNPKRSARRARKTPQNHFQSGNPTWPPHPLT